MNQIIQKVKSTIYRYNMLHRGDRVVVAVSGGPDSVCLLDILNKIKEEFELGLMVAHFNHGLRPDEDFEETLFVKTLSASLNLPFETDQALSPIIKDKGPLEEKARKARYCFLETIKNRFSAQKIAVGHNLNDQAETVIMRLLRGSGSSGLSGIPPVREGFVIRPLIEISRDEILSYLKDRHLEYVVDSSNSETRFLRNKIRLGILPELKKMQPRIVEQLGQTAEIMRREDQWMVEESERWVHTNAEIRENKEVILPLSLFLSLPKAIKFRVVRFAISTAGGTLRRISLRHIEAVNNLAQGARPQKQLNLPNGLIVKRIYDQLLLKKEKERVNEGHSSTLSGPGEYVLEDLNRTVLLEEFDLDDVSNEYGSKWHALLDADKLSYPLVIRNFRPGDRFVPLGMSGHRKIKDFFIDLKIPSEERARIPILTYKDMPVWICGLRIDDRFKVTPPTRKVLSVTMKSLK